MTIKHRVRSLAILALCAAVASAPLLLAGAAKADLLVPVATVTRATTTVLNPITLTPVVTPVTAVTAPAVIVPAVVPADTTATPPPPASTPVASGGLAPVISGGTDNGFIPPSNPPAGN